MRNVFLAWRLQDLVGSRVRKFFEESFVLINIQILPGSGLSLGESGHSEGLLAAWVSVLIFVHLNLNQTLTQINGVLGFWGKSR